MSDTSKKLVMYVHTHWGYNHPYAARSWTPADWEGYLAGIAGLGYDFVMVWPQLDCMPPEPNASDLAYLNTLGEMIDIAHERHDMKVAVIVCGNTIGNEKSAGYDYQHRPYFVCETRINPADPAEVEAFIAGRRKQLAPLAGADALSIIDSDPGGYIGSTSAEFVDLLARQIDVFRALNPSAELIYWMLMGWESYSRFWAGQAGEGESQWPAPEADEFAHVLSLMADRIAEPWSLYASTDAHNAAIDSLGLRDKAMWFPYGVIEGEPTFPLTNWDPAALVSTYTADRLACYPRGVMGNCQSHCLQLPHTYIFSHLARGGSAEMLDLAGFAENVLPGGGEAISRAWRAIAGDEADVMRAAAVGLSAVATPAEPGLLAGLLFGDGRRFIDDLTMNLQLRAELLGLAEAVQSGADVPAALRRVLNKLVPYQRRLGFVDAYGGPMYDQLDAQLLKLGDPQLDEVLARSHDWADPSVRNGIVPVVLDAMDEFCRRNGQ